MPALQLDAHRAAADARRTFASAEVDRHFRRVALLREKVLRSADHLGLGHPAAHAEFAGVLADQHAAAALTRHRATRFANAGHDHGAGFQPRREAREQPLVHQRAGTATLAAVLARTA